MDTEKAVIFYTVLIFGLGGIMTLDTAYKTTALAMFIQGILFVAVMYISVKIPLLRSKLNKLKITYKPKVEHWFELSKNNELSLYIHNSRWAKEIKVLYQYKKFADYQGKDYIKKFPKDLQLLNHLNEGTSHVLLFDKLINDDTRKIKIGVYQDGQICLYFGDALLTGFRNGTFEYIVSCSGEYRNEKFENTDFSVWLTIKDGVLIKMAKEL